MFPSKFLRSADLNNMPLKRARVRMSHVEVEKVGEDKRPVLYFQGAKKGLVLNVTNARMIQEITGTPETDHWKGRWITLMVTKVEYQGKRMDGIRVDYPDVTQAPAVPAPAVVQRPAPPPVEVGDADAFNDEPASSDWGAGDDEEPAF
jgi:hypothetical protein